MWQSMQRLNRHEIKTIERFDITHLDAFDVCLSIYESMIYAYDKHLSRMLILLSSQIPKISHTPDGVSLEMFSCDKYMTLPIPLSGRLRFSSRDLGRNNSSLCSAGRPTISAIMTSGVLGLQLIVNLRPSIGLCVPQSWWKWHGIVFAYERSCVCLHALIRMRCAADLRRSNSYS